VTPEQRKARAQLAAHSRWSRAGARAEHAEKLAAAWRRRMEDKVDPDRTLPPEERAKLVRSAKAAEMARIRMGRS
jgi:hypothetical protein